MAIVCLSGCRASEPTSVPRATEAATATAMPTRAEVTPTSLPQATEAVTPTAAEASAPTSAPTPTLAPTAIPTEGPSADVLAAYLREDFPTLDGSTSTIPMDKAIRTALLGDESEATHSKTYEALARLTSQDDPVDMLLAGQYHQEYLVKAKLNGADLVATPIAKEGFVFLVNRDNPVDTISQDDLRRIYSGDITNWKELGGLDAPIVAYQRNNDSGSQTRMVDFMGDAHRIKPPMETRVDGMDRLVDVIANYDNGLYAIGYSVYSFAAKQYTGNGSVKLVSVDGVGPQDSTIGDDTYPLVVYINSYYDRKSPTAYRAEWLTQWLLSDIGQQFIADAGYVNLQGKKAPTGPIQLLDVRGTGKELGETPASKHKYTWLSYDAMINSFLWNDNCVYLMGLKNQTVQNTINSKLKSMINEIAQYDGAYRAFLNAPPGSYLEKNWPFGDHDSGRNLLYVDFVLQNGYLSAELGLYYHSQKDWLEVIPYVARTAVFDLRDGHELSFTDMFASGSDFLPQVNDILSKTAMVGDGYLKTPFEGLTQSTFFFTLNRIIFPQGNDYFYEPTIIDIDYPVDNFLPAVPYDCDGLFIDKVTG